MNNKKENRSMYLYTALIFVVALLLILLAFFGQTNVSKLGNRANEIATQLPEQTQSPQDAEFARISNMAATLDAENKTLKAQLETHQTLTAAFSYAAAGDIAKADETVLNIDPTGLDDAQKVLYDEIIKMINKGEEQ